jgi:hypothetical protein
MSLSEIEELRGATPSGPAPDDLEPFMGKLLRVTAFDLAQERLSSLFRPIGSFMNACSAHMASVAALAFTPAAALPQIQQIGAGFVEEFW